MKGWYLLIALFVGALIFRRSAVGDERPQSHKQKEPPASPPPNKIAAPNTDGSVYGEPGSPALLAEYKIPNRIYGALG